MKMESLQNNLASYIAENSMLFNKHAERIVYALFGSSWAAMFTTETNLEKKQFYIVIFLCIYNRENEMCIFSKRNVHFLCFFSRFPSSYLMGF